MKTTRTVRIAEFGGPEKMDVTMIELPLPAAGEVQLRQTAIGFNYHVLQGGTLFIALFGTLLRCRGQNSSKLTN